MERARLGQILGALPATRLESQDFEPTIEFVERTKPEAQSAK
jgi:hypothetical protein